MEKYYQNIFYFVFTLVGLRLNVEVHTNRGRIDAVMEGKDWIMIFELKVDKSAQEALEQIKEKGYADQYRFQQKAIYLIGINFNSKERNVSGYVVEQLA
jgi:Holliday junction resolvase-like predicted endonuclease